MRLSWLQKTFLRGFTIRWNTSLSDTRGGQDGDLYRKPVLTNLPLNPDDNTEQVFQYNCESLRALDRLYELMALAERRKQPLHVYKVRCLMKSVSGSITATVSFHSTAVDRLKKMDA